MVYGWMETHKENEKWIWRISLPHPPHIPNLPSNAKAKPALRPQEKSPASDRFAFRFFFFPLALFFSLWLCSSKLLEHRRSAVDLQTVKGFLIITANRHFTYECTWSDALWRYTMNSFSTNLQSQGEHSLKRVNIDIKSCLKLITACHKLPCERI